MQLSPWDHPQPLDEGEPPLLPPPTQPEVEVITAIQNLANTVIANAASRSLAKYVSSLRT
jgi:rapamycin-insensitive companion of mTOR